jgi:hypothetical protein
LTFHAPRVASFGTRGPLARWHQIIAIWVIESEKKMDFSSSAILTCSWSHCHNESLHWVEILQELLPFPKTRNGNLLSSGLSGLPFGSSSCFGFSSLCGSRIGSLHCFLFYCDLLFSFFLVFTCLIISFLI